MARKLLTAPKQVAARLFFRFPTLYVDADHALIDSLTGNGNGREWYKGELVDSYFDGQTEEELLAEKIETEAKWAQEDRERQERMERRSVEPDPVLKSLVQDILDQTRAEQARRASDPAYAAEKAAAEASAKAAHARLEDPSYRKEACLLNLNNYCNMSRMPADIKAPWAAAVRQVAQMVLDLPDDWQEAVMPNQPKRYDVAKSKRVAAALLAKA